MNLALLLCLLIYFAITWINAHPVSHCISTAAVSFRHSTVKIVQGSVLLLLVVLVTCLFPVACKSVTSETIFAIIHRFNIPSDVHQSPCKSSVNIFFLEQIFSHSFSVWLWVTSATLTRHLAHLNVISTDWVFLKSTRAWESPKNSMKLYMSWVHRHMVRDGWSWCCSCSHQQ